MYVSSRNEFRSNVCFLAFRSFELVKLISNLSGRGWLFKLTIFFPHTTTFQYFYANLVDIRWQKCVDGRFLRTIKHNAERKYPISSNDSNTLEFRERIKPN